MKTIDSPPPTAAAAGPLRGTIGSDSIGRMISGFGELNTAQYRNPITETAQMARQCRVTFRPLPRRFKNEVVRRLRSQLQHELEAFGVAVLPWEEATTAFYQTGFIPLIRRPFAYKTCGVKGDVNAVIDVERPRSILTWLGIIFTEFLYLLSGLFRRRTPDSMVSIARLTLWSEDLAVRRLMDHRRTQVLTLARVDERLVQSDENYASRVSLGLSALARNLAQMVVGFSGSKISMINLNMSDSIYEQADIRRFTRHVLVPKLYVPIVPLLQSHFDVQHHDPSEFSTVADVAEMGRQLGPTGLLPTGHEIRSFLWRKSRSDIVRLYTDGRTGVSFGFIACFEKPQFVGPREISELEWSGLAASPVYAAEDVRRNELGRYYVRVCLPGCPVVFRQIPDLWIACSRSGSDKTALVEDRDVIRVGYDGRFIMSLPHGTQVGELKPSFDIRVMIALGLSAALYNPEFIEDGAAVFHFHGYPHRAWFQDREYFTGAHHPTVPCGTFEAGTFNFQAMARTASALGPDLDLLCAIEPDHGSNIMARDWKQLVRRIQEGIDNEEISLGSRHFHTLLVDEPQTTRNSHPLRQIASPWPR